jgi:hypothetical protein
MQVKTTVHESKVNQIHAGLPARIVIQGKEYTGRVIGIANQPEATSFMSANVKEYGTKVAIDGNSTGLKPGMTAQVEILIAEIKDAVTLPVTAVVEKSGAFYCYLKAKNGYEERELKLGRTNDTYIEVLDGVKEGDLVIRNPRAVVPAAREQGTLEDRAADRTQFGEGQPSPSSGSNPAPAADGQQRSEQPSSPQRPTASQIIQQSDTDKDGKLSKDEVQGPFAENFDAVDSDKDGFISAAEMTAAFAAYRNGGGDRGQRDGGAAGDQP